MIMINKIGKREIMDKKRIIFRIFVLLAVVLLYIIPVIKRKNEIEQYETKVKVAVRTALVELDEYKETENFGCITNIIVELEICESYLEKISMKKNMEVAYWGVSATLGQLRSFKKGNDIKGLEELEKALKYMDRDIYSEGEGYFISFVNKNMAWYNEQK